MDNEKAMIIQRYCETAVEEIIRNNLPNGRYSFTLNIRYTEYCRETKKHIDKFLVKNPAVYFNVSNLELPTKIPETPIKGTFVVPPDDNYYVRQSETVRDYINKKKILEWKLQD